MELKEDQDISIVEEIRKLGLLDQIKAVRRLIDLSETKQEILKTIAEDPHIEEVVFNVINRMIHEINRGSIDWGKTDRCLTLGSLRLAYLKKQFAGKPTGRNTPGKMEYDTTLDSVRELRKKLEESENK